MARVRGQKGVRRACAALRSTVLCGAPGRRHLAPKVELQRLVRVNAHRGKELPGRRGEACRRSEEDVVVGKEEGARGEVHAAADGVARAKGRAEAVDARARRMVEAAVVAVVPNRVAIPAGLPRE